MEFRRVGRTDLLISPIGFGAFGIGSNFNRENYGKTDDRESLRALELAFDLGCNFIDTANVYGSGHSEKLIGRCLKDNGRLDEIVIATKAGQHAGLNENFVDFTPPAIEESVENSLRRLHKESIDLLFLHNPSIEEMKKGDLWNCTERLIKYGKIRYCGVSVYTAAEADFAAAIPVVAAVQIVQNIFTDIFDDLGKTYKVDTAYYEDKQVAVIGREPLANGFLISERTRSVKFDRGDCRRTYPKETFEFRMKCAQELEAFARERQLSVEEFALRYAVYNMDLTSVIVGMKTTKHVAANLKCIA